MDAPYLLFEVEMDNKEDVYRKRDNYTEGKLFKKILKCMSLVTG